MDSGDLIVERLGSAGFITLNRPRALNALTLDMTRAIAAALIAFEADPAVLRVVIKAAGDRAFCAGGDIRALYDWGRAGRADLQIGFWREEYSLDWRLARYPKPVVALCDGLTMGGGVGLFIHAAHRIVTERAKFAMPEVGIGFFPDVGATHVLARAPRHIGDFLAVTGLDADAADMMALGVATRSVARADLAALEAALAGEGAPGDVASATLAPSRLLAEAATIEAAFSAQGRAAIMARLAASSSSFAAEALAAMRQKCPTSQEVALRQIAEARGSTLAQTLRRDFRIVCNFGTGPEFLEGIRAAVVDKDRAPKWAPFDPAVVARAFAPLGAGELILHD